MFFKSLLRNVEGPVQYNSKDFSAAPLRGRQTERDAKEVMTPRAVAESDELELQFSQFFRTSACGVHV